LTRKAALDRVVYVRTTINGRRVWLTIGTLDFRGNLRLDERKFERVRDPIFI